MKRENGEKKHGRRGKRKKNAAKFSENSKNKEKEKEKTI